MGAEFGRLADVSYIMGGRVEKPKKVSSSKKLMNPFDEDGRLTNDLDDCDESKSLANMPDIHRVDSTLLLLYRLIL